MFKIINTKNYIKVSTIQDAIELRKKLMESHKRQIQECISELNTDIVNDDLDLNTTALQFWIDRLGEDREILNELISVSKSN
uniref:Uncharacterized protein n=1 Tax=Siphoviridae sp. ct9lR64 TaxID=2826178 RepID=A0A8S5QX07_9CAUD|nr:MAG TPA: hypothetical protein [Siphoviridae sp. ct9lR64]